MSNEFHDKPAINAGYQKAEIEILKEKYSIEKSRYNQDCRKRALSAAESNSGVANPEPESILKAADKYYNWLIAIPS